MSASPSLDLSVQAPRQGAERLAEIIAQSEGASKFLPQGVGLRDVDAALRQELTQGRLQLVDTSGQPVPVLLQQLSRTGARRQTWELVDKDENLSLPLLTFHRSAEVAGSFFGTRSVIPQNKSWTYLEVPVIDNGRPGVERWQIPQPTPVDLTYELLLTTTKQTDCNRFTEVLRTAFASLQLYLPVNGHQFPMLLEEGSQQGTMEEVRKQRYLTRSLQLTVKAYLLREEDYTRVPAVTTLTVVVGGSFQTETSRFSRASLRPLTPGGYE